MAEDELNIREQISRIDRSMAEYHKLAAEEDKLRAEARKLVSEALKLDRERWWFPWLQLVTTVGGSAAVGALVGRLVH